MIVAKTPWLKKDNSICILAYACKGIDFACAYIVEEYFDIPVGATIRFVIYNRPAKDRYPAYVYQGIFDLGLQFNGNRHGDLFNTLQVFLKKFVPWKIYYVECEIK